MGEGYTGPLERMDDCRWRIPKSASEGMRVDGMIFADDRLINHVRKDRAPIQVINVAHLPGIVGHSMAMPDIHWGYGFPIGGVAATDPDQDGVISPGGVGYDINCGVRMMRTDLTSGDVDGRVGDLVEKLFKMVPCGVGQSGKIKFKHAELTKLMSEGVPYVIGEKGLGWDSDTGVTEAGGCIAGARPDFVSDHAISRGLNQCGTLGSGNHFIEIQVVDQVYDEKAASVFGVEIGQVAIMIHSGSRGLGYQVCEDAIRDLRNAPKKYGIKLPDPQLVCAPVNSKEGQRYLGAMTAAANYAWCNRQIMTHLVRRAVSEVLGVSSEKLGMSLIYDVAHNIAKMEHHEVGGQVRRLCVHRKGATRAFPPGHAELPSKYKAIGQPVIVPGDMGTHSYLLVGTEGAMSETFGSACHGAGRMMSRSAAIRAAKGRSIKEELKAVGVVARARGRHGLDEEQPEAYKDVNNVVDVLDNAGVAKRVVRLRPLGVIKG